MKTDCRAETLVIELFQDVILPLFRLFHIRGSDPHANQLEGGWLVTTTDRGGALIRMTEQPGDRG